MLSKELVAASTIPIVLSLLRVDESYGYEIIQKVRKLSGGRIEWTEGMLYPVLHWMENENLIEAEWRESENGRRRKYYKVSRTGLETLRGEQQQWLAVHKTLMKLWKPTPRLI